MCTNEANKQEAASSGWDAGPCNATHHKWLVLCTGGHQHDQYLAGLQHFQKHVRTQNRWGGVRGQMPAPRDRTCIVSVHVSVGQVVSIEEQACTAQSQAAGKCGAATNCTQLARCTVIGTIMRIFRQATSRTVAIDQRASLAALSGGP